MQRRLHLNELVLKHSSNLSSINNVNIIDESIFAYTCPEEDDLRKLIREKMHPSFHSPNVNLIFTSGSCMALEIIISWFRHQKNVKKALCYNKTFTMAIDSIVRHNYLVEYINIGLDHDKELDICWDELISKQTDTCLIYIPNPNNPTCHIVDNKKLHNLVKKFPQHIFLIDEAYQLDSITKNFEILPNMIVTQTLSKVYGAAGLRIGWVMGESETVPHFDKGLFSVGPASFKLGKAIYQATDLDEVKAYIKTGIATVEALSQKYNIPVYYEEHCLFFLIHGGRHPSKVVEALKQEDILIKNLSRDYKMWGWLRVSFDTDATLAKIFEILARTRVDFPNYYSGWFPESHFTKLRSLFRPLTQVLNQHEIKWWLTDGNLLGLRRGNSLLKWDDDIDIAILEEDEASLMSVFQELKGYGIRARKNRFGVYWQFDMPENFDHALSKVHIDCFIFHNVDGRLENTDKRFVTNDETKKEFNMVYDAENFELCLESFLDNTVKVPKQWEEKTQIAVNHKKWLFQGETISQLLFEPIVDDYKFMFLEKMKEILAYLKDKTGGAIMVDFDNTLFANARWWLINRELFEGEERKLYDTICQEDLGPLNPMMSNLIDLCAKNDIKIMVVTARTEDLKSVTEKNMEMYNFKPHSIYYRTKGKYGCTCAYKETILLEIMNLVKEKIWCTIGDQPSDHSIFAVPFLLPRTNLSECIHCDRINSNVDGEVLF